MRDRPRSAADAAVPPLFHWAAGAWVAATLLAVWLQPQSQFLLGEDRLIEWWTVTLYAVAGVTLVSRAAAARRPFDFLVGVFCLFVAGEEFSWGQRLFGYTPAGYFLENNLQQEANVHNMVKGRELLSYAMVGYGLLLPLLSRSGRVRRLLSGIGASAPPAQLIPWFVVAVVLVQWDPTRISGEFSECLLGALFVAATRRPDSRHWRAPAATFAAALLLTAFTGWRSGATADVACARTEMKALMSDLAAGRVVTSQLRERGTPSKRVWAAARDGDLDLGGAEHFAAARCDGRAVEAAADRRRFAVDPWGTGYYIAARPNGDGTVEIVLESFGPNRVRERRHAATVGDDLVETGRVSAALAVREGR